MADITLTAAKLPFVLGGSGEFIVRLGATPPDRPLPPAADTIFKVEAAATGSQPIALGGAGSWTLALERSATLTLTAVWPTSDALVRQYGLHAYFTAHPDDVVLLLTIGAAADGSLKGRLQHGALSATASLEAGSDVSVAYAHAYPRHTAVKELVEAFFADVRLPAILAAPPVPGEVITFEYGGQLKVGGELSVGYEVMGTASIEIGELTLAERYSPGIVGNAGLKAHVEGFFGVEVRSAQDAAGASMPGWARIIVTRKRATEFAFASDVSVRIVSELKGLPEAPHEFLGALLGVNVKNWLNLLDRVRTLTDPATLREELDDLAIEFLSAWLGLRIDPDVLPALRGASSAIVERYRSIAPAALTAFDRYFDQITRPAGGDVLTALQTLADLPSWDRLDGAVDPLVWRLVTELTDGDPLGWMAVNDPAALRSRAAVVLGLRDREVHSEFHALVRLAKDEFSVGRLVADLARIDSVASLKSVAGQRLGGAIERLLGCDITSFRESDLAAVLERLHRVLERVHDFEKRAYARLTEAVRQTVGLNLHVEYQRASSEDALIDIAINCASAKGRTLLHAAALGDFEQALGAYEPGLVTINRGRLTNHLIKARKLSINVIGWHAGWRYQGLERVILRSEQQIVADDRGGLAVYATMDLTNDRERKTRHERTYTNFLLRFLGEAGGAIEADGANLRYLLDTITRMSARYELSFTDDRTTMTELSYYLSFARAFGLSHPGVQPAQVAALLPLHGADEFGPVEVTYSVRYQDAGLMKLFSRPLDDRMVRRTMRLVVLSGYLRAGGELAKAGWAYWSPGVHQLWKASGLSFVSGEPREFQPIAASPFPEFAAPPKAIVRPDQQRVLDVLYRIEEGLVGGLLTLEHLIGRGRRGEKIAPRAFEKALSGVGDALTLIDDFGESINTTFAVFDALLETSGGAGRASSLTLTSQLDGRPVTKVFLAAGAPRQPD